MVKAQIHAGGRGKGTVTETGSHGVVLAKGLDKVKDTAAGILGGHLVTAQTNAKGKQVNRVLVAQDVYEPGDSEPRRILHERVARPFSRAATSSCTAPKAAWTSKRWPKRPPIRFSRRPSSQPLGLRDFQARRIAFNFGLSGKAFKEMVKFVKSLYAAYVGSDASMFEINPVLKTSDDRVIAVDAKVTLDGNSLYRHPDYAAMRDTSEEDATEVEAGEAGLELRQTRRQRGVHGEWCRTGHGHHGHHQAQRRRAGQLLGRGWNGRRGARRKGLPHHPSAITKP